MFSVMAKIIVGCFSACFSIVSYVVLKPPLRKYATTGFATITVAFWMLALTRFIRMNGSYSISRLVLLITLIVGTIAVVNLGIYLSLYYKQKRAK